VLLRAALGLAALGMELQDLARSDDRIPACIARSRRGEGRVGLAGGGDSSGDARRYGNGSTVPSLLMLCRSFRANFVGARAGFLCGRKRNMRIRFTLMTISAQGGDCTAAGPGSAGDEARRFLKKTMRTAPSQRRRNCSPSAGAQRQHDVDGDQRHEASGAI